MAAATVDDGPYGKGFDGRFEIGGFSGYLQVGNAAFPTTDSTCTIGLRTGGLNPAKAIVIPILNIVDKTLSWSITANTITFTRTDATSAAAFTYLIIYLS